MRTTLDLDPRLMQRIRRKALDERKSLKEIINQTLAIGLDDDAARSSRPSEYRLPVYSLGAPARNLDKALILTDEMENAAVVSELEMRK